MSNLFYVSYVPSHTCLIDSLLSFVLVTSYIISHRCSTFDCARLYSSERSGQLMVRQTLVIPLQMCCCQGNIHCWMFLLCHTNPVCCELQRCFSRKRVIVICLKHLENIITVGFSYKLPYFTSISHFPYINFTATLLLQGGMFYSLM